VLSPGGQAEAAMMARRVVHGTSDQGNRGQAPPRVRQGKVPRRWPGASEGYGRRGVLRAILPSGIIALRHLPPAGRGARALVTSDGIGGTVPSGDGCAGVPGCGSGAAGAVMVFCSGGRRGSAAASPAAAWFAAGSRPGRCGGVMGLRAGASRPPATRAPAAGTRGPGLTPLRSGSGWHSSCHRCHQARIAARAASIRHRRS
jgi:hypothetical protein